MVQGCGHQWACARRAGAGERGNGRRRGGSSSLVRAATAPQLRQPPLTTGHLRQPSPSPKPRPPPAAPAEVHHLRWFTADAGGIIRRLVQQPRAILGAFKNNASHFWGKRTVGLGIGRPARCCWGRGLGPVLSVKRIRGSGGTVSLRRRERGAEGRALPSPLSVRGHRGRSEAESFAAGLLGRPRNARFLSIVLRMGLVSFKT